MTLLCAMAACGWFEETSTLTLLLRCDPGVTGELSTSHRGRVQRLDVGTACKTGEVALGGHEYGQPLVVTYRHPEGEQTVTLTHDAGIESDRSSWSALVKLSTRAPWLAPDSI